MDLQKFIRNFAVSISFLPIGVLFFFKHGRRPFSIPTQLTHTERLLLYSLTRQLPRGATCVEIGSYLGGSAQFIGCATESVDGTLYCVDTWMSDGMTVGHGDNYDAFIQNVSRYDKKVRALRGLSHEIAQSFQSKINLLFIDGDHSYEGCRTDIEVWFPYLKDGATVIFHDFGWAEGVQKAVNEFVLPLQTIPGSVVHSMYWSRVSVASSKIETPDV